MSNSLLVREDVIFEKLHEISTTRSRWMITLVTDLTPYQVFIENLYADLNEINRITMALMIHFKSPYQRNFLLTFKGLETEIINLRQSQNEILYTFQDVKSLDQRSKRALLPIVGKALSFLFGTVSEDDLNAIRGSINNLATNQQKVIHVVEESLTILNTTRVEVAENRQAINDLIGALSVLSTKLQNETNRLYKEIMRLDYFVQTYLRIDASLEELRQMTHIGRVHVQKLWMQLNMLSLGHLSPGLISPKELKELLMGIKTKLPGTLQLPADPNKDIWSFYKLLTCSTTIDENKILAVVSVPLLDSSGKLEIFKAHILPSVMSKTSLDSKVDLVAQYALEAPALAIDASHVKYFLLDQSELQRCSDPMMGFCAVRSPKYRTNMSKLCIIAIFMQNERNMRDYCQIRVRTNSILPMATYVTDGQWIVSTKERINFAIVCDRSLLHRMATSTVTVDPPIQVVQLDMACSATTDTLTLPPYYHDESKYNISNSLNQFTYTFNLSTIKLWEPFHSALPNFTIDDLPKKLQNIKHFPMDSLIAELRSTNNIPQLNDDWPIWVDVIMGAVIVLGVVLFLYCYIKGPPR
jgi:hypothetical protein